MQLHFRNDHGSRLWVAIMFWSPDDCADYGRWGTRGWWQLDPGQQKYVLNTSATFAFFYAEADDGATWSGGPSATIFMYVTQEPFDSCHLIGSTAARLVSVRRLELGTGGGIIQPLS
ncbi:DUF1036 domain-containing protein [Actinomadura sp. 9N215]|uniref:DUF1036 domain-containing protein n=1 Tax=Actinomadura sp. 9N215 TaxID=3375150 RepID=UPI00379B073F